MKQFSYNTKRLIQEDSKKDISDQPMIELLRKLGVEDPQPIMSSNEFNQYWQKHVSQIAKFKKYDKNKRQWRDTSYSSIGIMDANDIYQEASLAFLKAWSTVNWDKIYAVDPSDRDKALWGYLKNTTALNLNIAIRNNKDGMRITQHGLFGSKESKEKNKNVKAITSLFHMLDKMYMQNDDDLGVSKYETDLIGFELDDIIDEVLDINARSGNRNLKGIERVVIKSLFGLDENQKTYRELSDDLEIDESTLRKVKQRALKKLKSPEVMRRISDFMNEYKLDTNSNARNY